MNLNGMNYGSDIAKQITWNNIFTEFKIKVFSLRELGYKI